MVGPAPALAGHDPTQGWRAARRTGSGKEGSSGPARRSHRRDGPTAPEEAAPPEPMGRARRSARTSAVPASRLPGGRTSSRPRRRGRVRSRVRATRGRLALRPIGRIDGASSPDERAGTRHPALDRETLGRRDAQHRAVLRPPRVRKPRSRRRPQEGGSWNPSGSCGPGLSLAGDGPRSPGPTCAGERSGPAAGAAAGRPRPRAVGGSRNRSVRPSRPAPAASASVSRTPGTRVRARPSAPRRVCGEGMTGTEPEEGRAPLLHRLPPGRVPRASRGRMPSCQTSMGPHVARGPWRPSSGGGASPSSRCTAFGSRPSPRSGESRRDAPNARSPLRSRRMPGGRRRTSWGRAARRPPRRGPDGRSRVRAMSAMGMAEPRAGRGPR